MPSWWLVAGARRFNYIPSRPAIEADYAAALRQAYAAFVSRQESRRSQKRVGDREGKA